jgi:DNA-directed RNA polymerase subunit M/transcription elongation factor TFIIS
MAPKKNITRGEVIDEYKNLFTRLFKEDLGLDVASKYKPTLAKLFVWLEKNTLSSNSSGSAPKIYDVYDAIENRKNHENIFRIINEERLDSVSVHELNPVINEIIKSEVDSKKKDSASRKEDLGNLSTEYECKKCKKNKVIIRHTHESLGLDELGTTYAICVNCNNKWRI